MHSEEADAMIDAKFLTEEITWLEQLLLTGCHAGDILEINSRIRYLITWLEQLLLTCYDADEILEINSHLRYLKSIQVQRDLWPRLIFNGRDVGRNITGI